MRTIAGTLKNPDGTGVDTSTLRFTAKATTPAGVIEGSSFSFDTSSSGVYSQSLEEGHYSVAYKQQSKSAYLDLGEVYLIAGDPITLEALLEVSATLLPTIRLERLYKDLELILETTSAGIQITGNIDAATIDASSDLQLGGVSVNTLITNTTDPIVTAADTLDAAVTALTVRVTALENP
jgi:hypothetical protein